MSILCDKKICDALMAATELALEPLGFAAGLLFTVDASDSGSLRGEVSAGASVPAALLAPARVGEEIIGRAVSGPATSTDLATAFTSARSGAALLQGFTFAHAIPLGSPCVAVLCIVAREAPAPALLERIRGLLTKVGALFASVADHKHRALLENMRQCVGETDAEGRWTYLNPAWTNLTGFHVESSIGKTFADFIHPDDKAAARERFAMLMAGHKPSIRPIVRYLFADGEHHDVEVFAHAFFGADGKASGTMALLSDANERHSPLEALRGSESNLRRLLDLSPEPVLIHQGGTAVYLNPAWTKALGRDANEDLAGTPIADFVAPADRPVVMAAEHRAQASQIAETGVVARLNRRDGVEVILEAAIVPLPSRRTPLVMVLGRDVTARVRADEALRRAVADAETAARTRSEFLANISHELRTPLHGILGMTELTLASQLDEDQRGQMRTVHECANGLLRIIDDLLDFSKVENGHVQLERAPFELWDILGEVMRPLAATASKKGLELVCHVDADVPTRLVGDGGRLRQLFFNLVGNAIKFSEKGEIVLEIVRQGGDDREVALCARVIDAGVGIPPAKLGTIFGAFEQADGGAARRFGGVGLGLALCQELVAAMGGKIAVESTLGVGSVFSVAARFPIAPPVPEMAKTFSGASLVVAASARVRGAIVAMLGPGAADTPAADGALRAIWVERPALVVLEASLPGAHDVEAAARRAGARLILLVAPGAPRPERMGAGSGRVVKPALAPSLRSALIGNSASIVVAPARMRSLSILLAEDNEINRRLMIRYLERLGHKVTPVENGRLALAALGKQRFELILMDVQMPELDGLTTTRIIRAREAQLGGHVPIVALTAHALGEHRDQCLAAGMDDYLVKPLPMEKLGALLARIAGASRPPGTESITAPVATDASVFDLERLKAMVGDDPEAIPELASLFISETPRHKHDLRFAHSAGDVQGLGKAAHKAKASFLAVAATEGGKLASDLENRARAGADIATMTTPLAALEAALDAVSRVLVGYVVPPPSTGRRSASGLPVGTRK